MHILGGEEFPNLEEISLWGVPQHVSLYNIYGITEVSCWASINKIHPTKEPSNDIGDPLSETIFEICGSDGNNEGELHIGWTFIYCTYESYH